MPFSEYAIELLNMIWYLERVWDLDSSSWFLFIKKSGDIFLLILISSCSQNVVMHHSEEVIYILQKTFCQINKLDLESQ